MLTLISLQCYTLANTVLSYRINRSVENVSLSCNVDSSRNGEGLNSHKSMATGML